MPLKNLPNVVRPLRLLWDVQSDNAADDATIFLRGTRDSFYAAAAYLIGKANQFPDVASVDVLQTDPPELLDNSIQSALMDVGTQLLAMASLELRQNTESPCILEFSQDGGATWTTFADLTLCAPVVDRLLRYNPATDAVEVSTDGGATWTADPSADPRSGVFNARPLLTGDDAQCVAANHMLAAFDAYFTKILAEADVGLAAAGIMTALLTLFTIALGGLPVVIDFLLAAATSAVGLGVSGLSSAWSTHKDAVFCIIYCHIQSDGSVTSGDVAAIKAQIDSDVGGIVAGHLDSLLASWGNIGLQNAGTVDEGETPLDCTSCVCVSPDCFQYAFTPGEPLFDHIFTGEFVPEDAYPGRYSELCVGSDGGLSAAVPATGNGTACTWTRVEVELWATGSGGGTFEVYGGNTLDPTEEDMTLLGTGSLPVTGSPDVYGFDVSGAYLYVRVSIDSPGVCGSGGAAWMSYKIFSGNLADAALESNC